MGFPKPPLAPALAPPRRGILFRRLRGTTPLPHRKDHPIGSGLPTPLWGLTFTHHHVNRQELATGRSGFPFRGTDKETCNESSNLYRDCGHGGWRNKLVRTGTSRKPARSDDHAE